MAAEAIYGCDNMLRPDRDPEFFHKRQQGFLPDFLGIVILEVSDGSLHAALDITPHHRAPNGFLHAASIVALADTSAGYGTVAHLPADASNFTTIELKTNFLGTARDGRIEARAIAQHLGKQTHVWDVTVTATAVAKPIALFRCTQMILY